METNELDGLFEDWHDPIGRLNPNAPISNPVETLFERFYGHNIYMLKKYYQPDVPLNPARYLPMNIKPKPTRFRAITNFSQELLEIENKCGDSRFFMPELNSFEEKEHRFARVERALRWSQNLKGWNSKSSRCKDLTAADDSVVELLTAYLASNRGAYRVDFKPRTKSPTPEFFMHYKANLVLFEVKNFINFPQDYPGDRWHKACKGENIERKLCQEKLSEVVNARLLDVEPNSAVHAAEPFWQKSENSIRLKSKKRLCN